MIIKEMEIVGTFVRVKDWEILKNSFEITDVEFEILLSTGILLIAHGHKQY